MADVKPVKGELLNSPENIENDRPQLYDAKNNLITDSHQKINNPEPILLSSCYGQSFFGRIWMNPAIVIKATEHYWSETSIHADSNAIGGGGSISTDIDGRVSGTIHPVNISQSVHSSSQIQYQQNIWFRLEQTGREESYKGFPVSVREGHRIGFINGEIIGIRYFPIKIVNLTTGYYCDVLPEEVIHNDLNGIAHRIALSIVTEQYEKMPKRSLIQRLFFPRKRTPNLPLLIDISAPLSDSLMEGLKRMIENFKY